MLLFSKILITVLVVLFLAIVAEYASPRLAGILSGYPIGSAIVLYFYALEYGVEFAAGSATYNLIGLVPTLVFASSYLAILRRRLDCSPLRPSLIALSAYGLSAFFLSLFSFSRISAVILAATMILVAARLARNWTGQHSPPRLPLSLRLLLYRVVTAASLVVVITSIAGWLSYRHAGLISAFPLVLYPLVLIVHLHSGVISAGALLSRFPAGLWSVLCYSLTISATYPIVGLNLGTVLGFTAATLCLLLTNVNAWLPTLRKK